jgi:hypothetical protein
LPVVVRGRPRAASTAGDMRAATRVLVPKQLDGSGQSSRAASSRARARRRWTGTTAAQPAGRSAGRPYVLSREMRTTASNNARPETEEFRDEHLIDAVRGPTRAGRRPVSPLAINVQARGPVRGFWDDRSTVWRFSDSVDGPRGTGSTRGREELRGYRDARHCAADRAPGRDRPGDAAVPQARCAKPRIGSRPRARSGAPLTTRSVAETATLAIARRRKVLL